MGIRADQAAMTRLKLLAAAREEFQRLGFAGGRVDAIAEDSTYRDMISQVAASKTAAASGLPADHLLALLSAILLAWPIPADVF